MELRSRGVALMRAVVCAAETGFLLPVTKRVILGAVQQLQRAPRLRPRWKLINSSRGRFNVGAADAGDHR